MLDLDLVERLSINLKILKKSLFKGTLALTALLSLYFLALTLISSWQFAWVQFGLFWYYIISLALGFGLQFSLYSYLRDIVRGQSASRVLVTTGTTSTGAMISCCAHYLTNILPILGVTGVVTFIGQYQVQFFWLGLTFNLLGIFYIGSKVLEIARQ